MKLINVKIKLINKIGRSNFHISKIKRLKEKIVANKKRHKNTLKRLTKHIHKEILDFIL